MKMVRMIPINNDIKFTMGFSSKESINFKQAIMYGVIGPLPSKSWALAAGQEERLKQPSSRGRFSPPKV